MATQKPPSSADKVALFPMHRFWEELEPDWEGFRLDPKEYVGIAARFAAAQKLGADAHLCLELDEVTTVLQPLGLDPKVTKVLGLHLHWLAGIYLSREHGKLLNSGPHSVRDRLEYFSKAAKQLNGALAILTPEALALLTIYRPAVPDVARPNDKIGMVDLLELTNDLALTADAIIETFPAKRRGSVVDVLRGRWIWSATTAIEFWTKRTVEVRQSDKEGTPKPRLIDPAAETLFRYLKLARPNVTKGEVVRVIVERRKASATGSAST